MAQFEIFWLFLRFRDAARLFSCQLESCRNQHYATADLVYTFSQQSFANPIDKACYEHNVLVKVSSV